MSDHVGAFVGWLVVMAVMFMPWKLPSSAPVFTFPPTRDLTAYPALVTVTCDQLNSTTLSSLLRTVQQTQSLAKFRVEDVLRKCIATHNDLHFDVFDYLQISYHGVALLRVRNNASNAGYSVDISHLY
jgi:hypothetical protein